MTITNNERNDIHRVFIRSSILFIYLFIHGLFNDAVSRSDYIASNDRMINE
jgi:hypothetical protein